MNRLKFVLLALAALGLWAAQAYLLTPALTGRAFDAARAQAERGALRLSERAHAHEAALSGAMLRLQAGQDLADAVGLRRAAPTAEQLGGARTRALEALPETLREGALVGLVNEAGQLWAVDDGAPRSGLDGVEAQALTQPGALTTALVAGEPHRFAALPLGAGEPGKAPTLVVGVKLPFGRWADQGVAEGGLVALGAVTQGKLVGAAGPQKGTLDRARGQLAAATGAQVLEHGPSQTLGPLALPAFTGKNDGAPRLVGVRHAVAGLGFDLIALAAAEPFTAPLADFQRFAFFAALGFLGLAVIAALTTSADGAEAPVAMSIPDAVRGVRPGNPAPAAVIPTALGRASAEPLPVADHGQNPMEASPDDFHFGHTRVVPLQGEGEAHGGADAAFEARPPPPVDPDFVPTASYPVHTPKADPFALAGDEYGAPPPPLPEDNPEATRVAAIPQELIRQSAHHSGTYPVPERANGASAEPAEPWSVQSVAPLAPPVDDEQQHFEEVFQDFVATREQCGETGDAMTFDRFVLKLRKNKDQLIQKYGCRTVRFQVYVKDGKAALKATPVRE